MQKLSNGLEEKTRYVALQGNFCGQPLSSKEENNPTCAELWQSIANNLKKSEDPHFKETLAKRSVQDRYTLLCKKQKKRMSYEKSASGISPEVTELDVLIEEAIEKEELSEEIRATESKIILISKIAQTNMIAIKGAHKYKLSNMLNVLL